MHLTLKLETTKPAAKNFLQQQAKFDDFIHCYNNERPHQALNMRCPAQLYLPSLRPYRGLPDLTYPLARQSRHCDHLRPHLLQPTENQPQPGLLARPSESNKLKTGFGSSASWIMIWRYFDGQTCRLEPLQIPSDQRCYLCLQNET